MKQNECYGDDVQGCTDLYVDYYGGKGAACAAAATSYFGCLGDQAGCDDFSACADEAYAFIESEGERSMKVMIDL